MSISDFQPAPRQLSFGPDTTTLVRSVLKACKSEHTSRAYEKAIADLDVFAEGRPISRLLILDWRRALDREGYAVTTINLRLTGVRKLIKEARRAKIIGADVAADLLDVSNLPQRGIQAGTWLTKDQCLRLLGVFNRSTLRGKRNYCVVAILLGCALRRFELAALTVEHLQMVDERWVIENLRGKGGRFRSVAIPPWVKDAIAAWMYAADIRSGRVIRQLSLAPEGLSDDSIMEIVSQAAAKIGVAGFGPHDLRRTCAKLCRKNGGELEQIQFMLGHASLVTTERYLGGAQNLTNAVNDTLAF